MKRTLVCALLLSGVAYGQFGRGSGDWSTTGGDAHRSSWVPGDPKISRDHMRKPGFDFLWKMKLENAQSLTTPVLLSGYIGYRGFRTLGYIGGSSGTVYAMDTDLGRMEWQKHFPLAAPSSTVLSSATATCGASAGMMANVARAVGTTFPVPPDPATGGGRSRAARSAVGEADEGAAILATMQEQARRTAAAAVAGSTPASTRPTPPSPPRLPNVVYAVAGDGMLHGMLVSNGDEPDPPLPFLPANAHAVGLAIVGTVAYAATTGGCGGVENGVWALDLLSKDVFHWALKEGEPAGWAGPAFDGDGILYVSTTAGAVLALDPKTMSPKDAYTAKGTSFSSSPVVFRYKEKTLVAATAKDGAIHLLDAANLATPVSVTPGQSASGALASWSQIDGTRWLLSATPKAIQAWKVVEKDGTISLEPGWVSRDIASPSTPLVINGVVFAASPTMLYALDGLNGQELWNSGATIASPVRSGTLAGGGSQVYVGAQDGTLYVFGYPIEH